MWRAKSPLSLPLLQRHGPPVEASETNGYFNSNPSLQPQVLSPGILTPAPHFRVTVLSTSIRKVRNTVRSNITLEKNFRVNQTLKNAVDKFSQCQTTRQSFGKS